MKQIFSFCLLLCMLSSAYAQNAGKVTRTVAKAIVTPKPSSVVLPRYGGNMRGVMGVDYHLTRAIALQTAPVSTIVPANTPAAPIAKRSWIEQQKRNVKAAQLKRQRQERDRLAAAQEQAREELEIAQGQLPALQPEYAFEAKDLSAFIPTEKSVAIPQVPFMPQPGTIAYRGLALSADGSSIKNILENGLRLQDVGEEHNTLRIAYASHGGYAALKHILETPVTNVTYGPQSAASWGAGRLSQNLPILTLVKIRGHWSGSSYEVAVEDIPASDLEEVAVRIFLNNELTWCKIEMTPQGTFLLTPYEHNYPLDK